MITRRPFLARALVQCLFALLWCYGLVFREAVAGTPGGMLLWAAAVLAWVVLKAAGLELSLPDMDHVPAWRGARIWLSAAILATAFAAGGVYGLVIVGFALGLAPLTPLLLAVAVVLSVAINVPILETINLSDAGSCLGLWRYAAAAGYVTVLLGYLVCRNLLEPLQGEPKTLPAAVHGLLMTIVGMAAAFPIAYMATVKLRIADRTPPDFPAATDMPPPLSWLEYLSYLALLCIGVWLLKILWRRLATVLERRTPDPLDQAGGAVYGTEEELADIRSAEPARRLNGIRRKIVDAYLEFFRFLAEHGIVRPPGTTADRYLAGAAKRCGSVELYDRATRRFNVIRYSGRPVDKHDAQHVKQILENLRKNSADAFREQTAGHIPDQPE